MKLVDFCKNMGCDTKYNLEEDYAPDREHPENWFRIECLDQASKSGWDKNRSLISAIKCERGWSKIAKFKQCCKHYDKYLVYLELENL